MKLEQMVKIRRMVQIAVSFCGVILIVCLAPYAYFAAARHFTSSILSVQGYLPLKIGFLILFVLAMQILTYLVIFTLAPAVAWKRHCEGALVGRVKYASAVYPPGGAVAAGGEGTEWAETIARGGTAGGL
jgi:hypothetical protein